MMIHPKLDTTETKITNIDEACVQPNAVDVRVAEIYKYMNGTFVLGESEKMHLKTEQLEPAKREYIDNGKLKTIDCFFLPAGCYKVVLNHRISVGEYEAGFVIARSSLTRNGTTVFTGLYDSGYEGPMLCGLNVTTGVLMLERNARIGQYLCFNAESVHSYNGSYQHGIR